MSATDELRKLLDERGVKWGDTGARVYDMYNNPHSYRTEYELSDGRWTTATEALSGTLNVNNLTPEQAIAATLGRGTCHIEERYIDWYCDACFEMVGTCDTTSELFIDGNAIKLWNYCPNCGKRVKRREQ